MVDTPILNAVITRIMDSGLSTRWIFLIMIKIGMTTICEGSKMPSMAMDIPTFLYFHRILVNAYANMVDTTTVNKIVSNV